MSDKYLIPIITAFRVKEGTDIEKLVSLLENIDTKDVLIVDNIVYVRRNGKFTAEYIVANNLKYEINK